MLPTAPVAPMLPLGRKHADIADDDAVGEGNTPSKRCKPSHQAASGQELKDVAMPSSGAVPLQIPPPSSSPPTWPSPPQQSPSPLSFSSCQDKLDKALFCTTSCILGLVTGGAIDPSCPNRKSHGHTFHHPPVAVFRKLLRQQLAQSHMQDANVKWMGLSGSTGTVFKVRLSSLGYTIVAKAGSRTARAALYAEENIYQEHLRPLQEACVVPPCLGIVDLPHPWYDRETESDLVSCLLLGWIAGQPPYDTFCRPAFTGFHRLDPNAPSSPLKQRNPAANPQIAAVLRVSVRTSLEAVHRLGVLHGDAALRNILIVLSRQPEELASDLEVLPLQAVLIDLEKAMPRKIWIESWQRRKKRQQRRQRRQQQQQQQKHQKRQLSSCSAGDDDDQETRFQAACEQELKSCLGELDRWLAEACLW